jgi:hypothetical protein
LSDAIRSGLKKIHDPKTSADNRFKARIRLNLMLDVFRQSGKFPQGYVDQKYQESDENFSHDYDFDDHFERYFENYISRGLATMSD